MKKKIKLGLMGLCLMLAGSAQGYEFNPIPLPLPDYADKLKYLTLWSFVSTPFEYYPVAPYDNETWTFYHPGAGAMRIHFDSVVLNNDFCENGGRIAKVLLLNSSNQVVQEITQSKTNFASVDIPGGRVSVRYLAGENNAGVGYAENAFMGAMPPGVVQISGYAFRRSILDMSAAANLPAYSLMSPVVGPNAVLKPHTYYQGKIPVMFRRPFAAGEQSTNQIKADVLLDGKFIGSAMGIPKDGQWYFCATFDATHWLARYGSGFKNQEGLYSQMTLTAQVAKLTIRETRYLPSGPNRWSTGEQTVPFSAKLLDDRLVYSFGLNNHSPTFDKVFSVSIGTAGMLDVRLRWSLGGNDPSDNDLFMINDYLKILDVSAHHGCQEAARDGMYVEGLRMYLQPGSYYFVVRHDDTSCSGTGMNLEFTLPPGSGSVSETYTGAPGTYIVIPPGSPWYYY